MKVLNFFGFRLSLRLMVMVLIGLTLAWFIPQSGMFFTKLSLSIFLVLAILDLHRFIWKMNRQYSRFFDLLKYREYDSAVSEGLPGNIGRWVKTVMLDTRDHLKNQEEGLIKKQRLYELSFEMLHEGVVVLDADGNVILANKTFQSFAPKQRESIGKQFHQWKDVSEVETDFLLEDGKQIHLKMQSIDSNGDKLRIALTSSDQQSYFSQSVAENFVQVMGHEIRNGITPILSISSSLTEILKNDSKNTPDNYASLKKGLSTIHEQAEKMIAISDRYQRFLQTTPPIKEQIPVEKFQADIESIVPKNISCRFVTKNSRWLSADPGQLHQVIQNLVDNARKALVHQTDPRISIRLEQQNQQSIIYFSDNGIGIPEGELSRIFDPFLSLNEDGTGIGLSLCRKIIWMHGGKINVSVPPEGGTCFTIRLPI